ncbi:MAG: T9SS type A sorting domain-containing protein [Crocinitomicaceae bacterium]|nr:T9SS type A sorting domain-containing protein [Flavobacteriales bacterium]NQZ37832.1 T9SS type A sorting domain-containing protein [Crocinitomicaceae bacterium]
MKQLLLFSALIFSTCTLGQIWTQNDDFNGGKRFAVSYFTLEGQAYLMGGIKLQGSNYIAYDDLWRYDVVGDNWIPLPDYPGGNTYGAFTFVIEDTAYIGLGANQFGTYSSEVWSYNATVGWQQIANFPGPQRVYPFSFSAADKGYIGSGWRNNFYSDLWEYDPATDTWTAKTDYPGGGRVGQVAFSTDNAGYVGLGDDGSFYYNDLYEYDPAMDTWTSKASFNGSNRSFSSNIVIGDEGYMIGGESVSGGFTNEMWAYNTSTNTWNSAYNFSASARRHAALYFLDDIFYYGLGQYDFDDSHVNEDFWQYSGVASTSEVYLEDQSEVYPNPCSDQLNISLSNNVPVLNVKVYNGQMQEIYNGNESQINTSHWQDGIYYLILETSDGIQVKKIIKS